MPELDLATILLLVLVAFAAGMVDAIAGGGGLVTVPALVLAGLTPAQAVATNKLQAVTGVATATVVFRRAGHVDLGALWPSVLTAVVGSVLGALVLQAIDTTVLRTLMPAALVTIALYFALSPALRDADARARLGRWAFALLPVPVIAFYDGVFGPGAGSLYLLGAVVLLGHGVRRATGTTKLLNLTSNAASLVAFLFGGQIVWAVGLPMIVGQVLGGLIGARLVIGAGVRLVKPVVIAVALALAARLALGADHPFGAWLRG